MSSTRVVALFSGGATNLGHLVEAVDAGQVPVRIVGAIASRRDAPGIARARGWGVPVEVVARRELGGGARFQESLHAALAAFKPDLLVLCGFLSKLEPREFSGRTLNIHPALIPAFSGAGFYGARVHEAVLASGVKLTGVTVHFCDDEYDTGPIVAQEAVPVHDDDTVATLAARVQAVERELYPRVVRLFAEGRLEVRGRRVHVR